MVTKYTVSQTHRRKDNKSWIKRFIEIIIDFQLQNIFSLYTVYHKSVLPEGKKLPRKFHKNFLLIFAKAQLTEKFVHQQLFYENVPTTRLVSRKRGRCKTCSVNKKYTIEVCTKCTQFVCKEHKFTVCVHCYQTLLAAYNALLESQTN